MSRASELSEADDWVHGFSLAVSSLIFLETAREDVASRRPDAGPSLHDLRFFVMVVDPFVAGGPPTTVRLSAVLDAASRLFLSSVTVTRLTVAPAGTAVFGCLLLNALPAMAAEEPVRPLPEPFDFMASPARRKRHVG